MKDPSLYSICGGDGHFLICMRARLELVLLAGSTICYMAADLDGLPRRSPRCGLAHSAPDAKIPVPTTRMHVDRCVHGLALVTQVVLFLQMQLTSDLGFWCRTISITKLDGRSCVMKKPSNSRIGSSRLTGTNCHG
jgi:hypothetical protein